MVIGSIKSASRDSYIFYSVESGGADNSFLNFRCRIPECDLNCTEFNPKWLSNAIPFENGAPKKCSRYKYNHYNESDNLSTFCPAIYFDKSVTQNCKEFIFKTDEQTILSEVNSVT